jgi:hypothetical protein
MNTDKLTRTKIEQHITKGQKVMENLKLVENKVDEVLGDEKKSGDKEVFRFSQVDTSLMEGMQMKLDNVLFENINQSKGLYERVVGLLGFVDKFKADLRECKEGGNKIMAENLDLKSVIAQLQVRYKLINNH